MLINTINEHIASNTFSELKIDRSFLGTIKSYLPTLLQLLADLVSIAISLTAQIIFYSFRGSSELVNKISSDPFQYLPPLFLMVSIYWISLFFFSGLYKNWFERSPFDEMFSIIKVTFIGCLIFLLLLISEGITPKLFFLVYFAFFTFFLIIFRTIARRFQRVLRNNGILKFTTIVVGNNSNLNDLKEKLNNHKDWGFDVVGEINLEEFNSNNEIIEKFEELTSKNKVEIVVYNPVNHNQSSILEFIAYLSYKNVRIKIQPDLYHIFTGQTKTHNIYGIPFIEINPQLLKPWQAFAKRFFDIVFSLLVLIVGFPIWFVFALIILITSPGGVFYTQSRVGKNNQKFKIYKFRSMIPNNDEHRWAVNNDPRVTKFGKFIRKTHLDEIPQFWNVVLGDMSVVGPRPEQADLVERFANMIPYYNRRHAIRPGITGWWQVKYGIYEYSREEIENRLKDDFYYIENLSIKFDIEIIIRTVWCVIKGHGQA